MSCRLGLLRTTGAGLLLFGIACGDDTQTPLETDTSETTSTSGPIPTTTTLTSSTTGSTTDPTTTATTTTTGDETTGTGSTGGPSSHPISGDIIGVRGDVVLQNNGGDDITLDADGPFAFLTEVDVGQPFEVTVASSIGTITCTVENGAGNANVPIDDVLVTCSDKLVFAALSTNEGREPWITDGTPAGTELLRDIYSGTEHSSPGLGGPAFLPSGVLVFSATNADGRSVWTTDGTEAGTTRVAVAPQPVGFFVAFGDHVYFAASDADGVELWRTDGTAPNTTQVMDIDDGGDSDPQGLIVRGGLLLFSADDGSGRELWSTDGTTTTAVIDLNPNLGDSAVLSDPFPVPGDRIGFAGTDGTGGIELGLSNGTLGGTALFEIATGALSSTPMFVGAMGTYTLFEAVGDDGELDLWRTDGTAGNTAMVLDYGVVGAVHGAPGVALDNGIVYALETTAQGIEPWFSNGSTQGSAIISDIVTDAGSSDPGMMGRIDDTVIMHLDDGVTGRELWRTDGTAGNTAMIVDLNGSGDGVDAFIGQIGGLIVFAGDDGSGTGLEPWVTDASQDGTVLLADVCTPTCDSVGPIN